MRFLLLTLLLAAAPSGAAELLLIGNKGEDTLSFVDLGTAKELARLPTGRMPHEIAISPDGRTAAVVAYGGTSIDLFDVARRTKLRTVELKPNDGPHGLVWMSDGRLLATAERSQTLVLVEPRTGTVVPIATGQPGTHMVAVSPDRRRAYTANIPAGTVSVIDLATRRKLRDLPVGGRPEGIAVSPDGRTLWVADLDGARVQVFATNRVEQGAPKPLAVIPTGGRPIRVLLSPDGRLAVTSNFLDGTLTVIDALRRQPLRTIAVSGDEKAEQVTILFSRDGRNLFVAETGRNQVAEVELASGRVLRRLPAGEKGDGLALASTPR